MRGPPAATRLGVLALGQQHRRLAVVDRVAGDDDLLHVGPLGDVVHHLEQRLLHDRAQSTRAGLAVERQPRGGLQRFRREDELHLVEAQELRELLGDRVLRLGQDLDEVLLGERREAHDTSSRPTNSGLGRT